jgi:hypothetical protein
MLRNILRLGFLIVGSLWLWALWLNLTDRAFRPDLPLDTTFWERLIAAGVAGLADIPYTFGLALELASGPAETVREEFAGEVDATRRASSNFLETAKVRAIGMALYAWWAVVVPLSIVQFCVLFVLRGFGASVLWDYPGIPRLENMTAKAVIWIALGAIAYGIAVNAYAAGVWTSIAAAIALPLVLLFPIVGTLPLWIIKKVLRIDPYELFRLPLRALNRVRDNLAEKEEVRQAEVVSPVPKAPPRETVQPPPPKPSESQPEPPRTAGPWPPKTGPSYENACKTFGLAPHAFTQAEIATKYRELMRGARGAPERAKSINLAYEAVLSAHGWNR